MIRDLEDYFDSALTSWAGLHRRTAIMTEALATAQIYNDYILHFEQLLEIINAMSPTERDNWFAVTPDNAARPALPRNIALSAGRHRDSKNLRAPEQLTGEEIALLLQRYEALRCVPPRPRDEYYLINAPEKIKILAPAPE